MSELTRSLCLRDAEVRELIDAGTVTVRRPIVLREFQPSRTPGYKWTFRGTRGGSPRKGTWQDFRHEQLIAICPIGEPGESLWVKERVIQIGHELRMRNGCYAWPRLGGTFTEEVARRWFDQCCIYVADTKRRDSIYDEPHGTLSKSHMPRWASRLTVTIAAIRVEQFEAAWVWVAELKRGNN